MNAIDQARKDVFKNLWTNYFNKVSDAPKIEAALKEKGELWAEDHVAFRCLPGEHTGSHILKAVFEALGYKEQDTYRFEEKKLNAFWMAPPDTEGKTTDASPKIFISEWDPASYPESIKNIVSKYTSTVEKNPIKRIKYLSENLVKDSLEYKELVATISKMLTMPPPWQRPSFEDYNTLKEVSEYVSWTLLFGTQINHFTVSVQDLKLFSSIKSLYDYLESDLKIPMNSSGGAVKGSEQDMLEQISTMAVKLDYVFQNSITPVPYGFVEFAYRYPKAGAKADGQWHSYYQGFVPASANKIFESTFTK